MNPSDNKGNNKKSATPKKVVAPKEESQKKGVSKIIDKVTDKAEAVKEAVETKQNLSVLQNLFNFGDGGNSGLVEMPEFVKGVFELISDGFKTAEDGKVNAADLFNFIDFQIYLKAFGGLGTMIKVELAEGTDEQIFAAIQEGKDRFDLPNDKIESSIEMVVTGIIGGLRLVAVIRNNAGSK